MAVTRRDRPGSDPPADRQPAAPCLSPPATAIVVPGIIADAGDQAARRFLEFFAATIRNRNTRMAYMTGRSAGFFGWCDQHRIGQLADIEPLHVAAYIEALGQGFREADRQAAPGGDPHAVRLAGHWPGRRHQPGACGARAEACGQNRQDDRAGRRPGAHAARQHRYLDRGRTARPGADRPDDLRFARVSAAVAMDVEDYHPKGKRWWVRLHEKGGKRHEMPAHHNLEAYLDAYIEAAGIRDDKKDPLFRSAAGRTGTLTEQPHEPRRRLAHGATARRGGSA